MKGTINEEINNLLDNMFSNENVHTEIRHNQITIDKANRLCKAKPSYNHLMMVVLCQLSEKDFILKNKKELPRNVFVDGNFAVEIQQRRHTLTAYPKKNG